MKKTAICTREKYSRRVASAKNKKRESRAIPRCDSDILFLVIVTAKRMFFLKRNFFPLQISFSIFYFKEECIQIIYFNKTKYVKYCKDVICT